MQCKSRAALPSQFCHEKRVEQGKMFLLIYLCEKLSSGVSGGDDEARGSGRGGFGSKPHFRPLHHHRFSLSKIAKKSWSGWEDWESSMNSKKMCSRLCLAA